MRVSGPITPVVRAAAQLRAARLRQPRAEPRGDVPRPVRPGGCRRGPVMSTDRSRPSGRPPRSPSRAGAGSTASAASTPRRSATPDSRSSSSAACSGSLLLSSGVGFGQAYSTLESRADLATLVANLPPAMTGLYGNPFPTHDRDARRVHRLEDGASFGLIVAHLVDPRPVVDTRRRGAARQPGARRGDAARSATDRPREAGRAPDRDADRHGRRRGDRPGWPEPRSGRCRGMRSRR